MCLHIILLGGLFDTNDGLQRAFETSIKRVNEQRHMSDAFPNVFFVAKSNEIDTDPFNVSQIGTVIIGNTFSLLCKGHSGN